MTIKQLTQALNDAISDDSLSLTKAIAGVDWVTDMPTAIQTYLKATDLGISASGLKAVAANSGSVQIGGTNTASALVKGKATGPDIILGIPIADIELYLYATPNEDKADYTIILQFTNSGNNGFSGWTPADSFSALKGNKVFEVLIADNKPSYLLSSFEHDQSWNFTNGNAANTFSGVQANLNLQLPSGISTKLFPPLEALFGDETLAQLYFNGTVDNSKTTEENPNALDVLLMAVMGANYNKSFPGSDSNTIKLEFDLGFEASPVSTGSDDGGGDGPSDKDTNDDDDDKGITLIKTQAILQARIGPAIIRAIIPLVGRTIAFSMNGVNGQPALSISDLVDLFSTSFLNNYLPPKIVSGGTSSAASPQQLAAFTDDKCSGESFLERVGIYNVGLTLNMPTSGTTTNRKGHVLTTNSSGPKILSILLKVGYDCNAIGFPPWFDLQEFFVTWSVKNPFTDNSAPSVILEGDLELLEGDIAFNATFAKKTQDGGGGDGSGGDKSSVAPATRTLALAPDTSPTSNWVFSINGGLIDKPDNVINLTSILEQFESHSKDLPEIDIDALAFSATPAESKFAISFEIVSDPPWKFLGFANPKFDSLALDVNKNKTVYTGSIDTKFSFESTHPAKTADADEDNMIVFELSAERTEDSWIFEGKNEDAFTLEDFSTAMGLKNTPEYLNEVDIKQIDIKYTAPITKATTAEEDPPPPPEGSSVFEITIDTTFGIANEELEVTLDFTKEKESWALVGSLIIGPKPDEALAAGTTPGLEFDFSASSSGSTGEKDTILKATLKEESGKSLNISDFATALGVTPPDLPEALNDIALVEAGFEYETKPGEKSFLFKADSAAYGNIVFVIVKTKEGASWKPFFGINFKPTINFNQLPVVGKLISKFGKLAVEGIMLAGVPIQLIKGDIDAMNALLQEPDNQIYPQLPAVSGNTIPAEAIFDATIDLNSDKKKLDPIIIPLKKAPPTVVANAHATQLEVAEDPPAEGGGEVGKSSDQKVGKSFGPVTIDKFNISYASGAIVIDVNGSMTLAGMEMSFEGLGVRMKFPPKSISDVSFQLHGLGINVQKGDLRIAGGFIAAGPEAHPFQDMMGMLAINAGTIGLQAFGGYSSSPESFFIFLHLEMPIGGPPFFFVDGISGGFGINRNFILPDFSELGTFPLLPSASNNPIPSGPPTPEGESKPGIDDITAVLLSLAKYIPPKEGAYWIAVGLDFTSFELLQVSAILEITFGKEFQIGLLGNASMSIPEPLEPIAFISINFEVKFAPAEGILAVIGEITPSSFLFSNACQLSGGFAFYTWFKGEHEGDFVVTIGGYHPDFTKPAWYPPVPRLELKWDLGPLHIDGKSFFALTPHVLMAGLDISATWSGGPVKAWFDMGIDFILGWKPFFYEAEAYIHLGASIHIIFTITIHIGADIKIWGPEFGGEATIDLDIFSFTIHFGSKGPTPPPIPWSEFKKLMPNTHPDQNKPAVMSQAMLETTADADATPFSVSSVNLAQGLLKEISKDPLSSGDLNNDKIFNWVIDPNHFRIQITAGVPSDNFAFNTINAREDKNPAGDLLLTPAAGSGEYVLPSDLESFYSNPNQHQDPNDKETIFAYDYEAVDEADYWWKQEIGVAPVNISPEDFGSTLQINLYNVGDGSKVNENNVVLTVVSSNAAKSLWGSQVTATNGSGNLNQKPTIKNTLGGVILSTKIWHPLQTRAITLYDLIFQLGNQVNWAPVVAPTIGPNTFAKAVTNDGDTMTFKDKKGDTVTSDYRILSTKAFTELATGEALISELVAALGQAGLSVNTNAADMATPRYEDWPVLALLGEEDNQVN